jgi:hypothetical protein
MFFFSYSRRDWNRYLERFYRDLRAEVALLSGADDDAVAFLDRSDVRSGDEWDRKISEEARLRSVLVCIYSPRYFSPNRTHEFCAKEVMAFVMRAGARPEDIEEGGAKRTRWKGTRNILPVLWVAESDLLDMKPPLPPFAVASIQYSLAAAAGSTKLNDIYIENGILQILKKRRAAYSDIVIKLARLIKELSENPLPQLEPPDRLVSTLENAFWPNGTSGAGADDVSGTDAAAPPPSGTHILAFEIRESAARPAWTPYAGGPPLVALVEEIAEDVLQQRLSFTLRSADPSAEHFSDRLGQVLKQATRDQLISILVVDPGCLAQVACQKALLSLVSLGWRGGLLIPIDKSDDAAAQLIAAFLPELERARDATEPIMLRVARGTIEEFHTAGVSVAADMLAHIVGLGVARRPAPENDGPDTRPRIANTVNQEPATAVP